MKYFIDSKLLKKITSSHQKDDFIDTCKNIGISLEQENAKITFTWSSLLEYIDLETILETFPKFNEENIIFSCLVSNTDLSDDNVIELFDKIFVECLTQVKAIPEINPSFLLEKIREKEENSLFSATLNHYEHFLSQDPYAAAHDLILYLAFDRVCVYLANLFECPKAPLNRLSILKECLLESFQHITKDGKTIPGFFRLVEALYALQMREEYLETHSDEEWLLLCKSSNTLKDRDSLIGLSYIDCSLAEKNAQTPSPKILTSDSKEMVEARINLARHVTKKLNNWNYNLLSPEVFHITKDL